VQLATPTGGPFTVWQRVATKPLPELAAAGVQVPTFVHGWTTIVLQVVFV
jgi:hypothetical protein